MYFNVMVSLKNNLGFVPQLKASTFSRVISFITGSFANSTVPVTMRTKQGNRLITTCHVCYQLMSIGFYHHRYTVTFSLKRCARIVGYVTNLSAWLTRSRRHHLRPPGEKVEVQQKRKARLWNTHTCASGVHTTKINRS